MQQHLTREQQQELQRKALEKAQQKQNQMQLTLDQRREEHQRQQQEEFGLVDQMVRDQEEVISQRETIGILRSTHDLTPTEAPPVEDQLRAGAPEGYGKIRRNRWNKQMNRRLGEARERDTQIIAAKKTFFTNYAEDHEAIRYALGSKEEQQSRKPEQYADIAYGTTTRGKPDFMKLVSGGSVPLAQYTKILVDMDPAQLKQEEVHTLIARYKEYNLSSHLIGESQLDETIEHNPQAAWVFLMQCATNSLVDLVNGMPSEQVDQEEFSKLYALAQRMSLVATTMYSSAAYHEEKRRIRDELLERSVDREALAAAEQIVAAEQERLSREDRAEMRKDFIRTGKGELREKTDGDWPLGDFADAAIRILREDLLNLPDEEFARKVSKLQRQLELNLWAVDREVDQISSEDTETDALYHVDAFKEIIKSNILAAVGDDILLKEYGTEKVGGDSTERLTMKKQAGKDSLTEAVHGALESEALKQKIAEVKKNCRTLAEDAVSPALKKELLLCPEVLKVAVEAGNQEDAADQEAVLAEMKENIAESVRMVREWAAANMPGFEGRFCERFFSDYGRTLISNSSEQTAALLVRMKEDLKIRDHSLFEAVEEAKRRQQASASGPDGKPVATANADRMKGTLLLADPIFEGAFKGFEDDIVEGIAKVAATGAYEAFGLKSGSTMQDLNNLSPYKMRPFITKLKEQLSRNVQLWKEIHGLDATEVKKKLATNLLSEAPEQFRKSIAAVDDERQKDEIFQKIRIRQLVLGEKIASKNAVYDYKKRTKANTGLASIFVKESRQQRRQDRMAKGREIRAKELKEAAPNGNISKWELTIREIHNYARHPDQPPHDETLLKDYAYLELALCDNEVYIADHFAESVISKSRGQYVKDLTPHLQFHLNREIAFYDAVRDAGFDVASEPIQDLYERLLPIMNDTKEDYRKVVKEALSYLKGENEKTAEGLDLDQRALGVVETRERRLNTLRQKGGVAVEPFIPIIMEDSEYFKVISIYSDERFEALMQKFEKTLIPAAQILATQYEHVPAFVRDQLIHNLQDIFFTEGKDVEAELTKEYKAILDSNLGFFSTKMSKRIEDLRSGNDKKYKPLAPYFDVVMEMVPQNVLEKDATFNKYLDSILAYVVENGEARDAFLQTADFKDVLPGRIEAVKATFKMRTRLMIAQGTQLQVEVLQKILDECIQAEPQTIQKTEEATKSLAERRSIWSQIETEKSKGRVLARERHAATEAMEYKVTERVKKEHSAGMAKLHEAMGTKRDSLSQFQHAFLSRFTLRPYLYAEYRETLRYLSYAMYETTDEQFIKEVEERKAYFNAAAEWDSIVTAELTARELQDDNALAVGIQEYFYAKLNQTGDVNLEDLKKELIDLLGNEMKSSYLADSVAMLGSISYDSMSQSEMTPFTVMNREQFADLIRTEGGEDLFKEFNSLSVEERKVFAIVLSIPGMIGETESMPGMEYVYTDIVSRKEMSAARGAIGCFREGQEIKTSVDYAAAAMHLTKYNSDGLKTIDEDRFKQALEFAKVASYLRQKEAEVDIERIGQSPEKNLEELGKNTKNLPLDVATIEDFATKVSSIQDNGGESVKKRFAEFAAKGRQDHMKLLIMILQDRSLVDYTTKVGWYDRRKGAFTPFVNDEGRTDWMAAMGDPNDAWLDTQVSGEMLRQAMAQIFSYQIQDDEKLASKLKENDIAHSRSTLADWDMLDRAMDFVDELIQRNDRLKAVRQASTPDFIRVSDSARAVGILSRFEHENVSKTDLENFLLDQAKQDNELACIAGFLRLSEDEKTLFFTALAHRDVLDISKNDITLDRFGLKDRDFVNPAARNALMDEYIANGKIMTDGDLYKQALFGSISTQINDDEDFKRLKTLADAQTSRSNIFKSGRETGIDWKLFARGLQIVNRANMERDQQRQEQELADTYTDVVKHGVYRGDFSMMRGNVHHAGTRFTRFLSHRVADEMMDLVPKSIQFAVRSLLPVGASNAINGLKPFAAEDNDDSFVGTVGDLCEKVSYPNDYLNEDSLVNPVAKVIKNADGSGVFGDIMDNAETVAEYADYISNGLQIAEALNNQRKLYMAQWDAADMHDEVTLQKTKQEMEKSSEVDKKIMSAYLEQSWKENERGVNLGVDEATARNIDKALEATAELLSDPAEKMGEVVGPIIVKEAEHLIAYFRSYFHDKQNLAAFFKEDVETKASLKALAEKGITVSREDAEDLDFILRARGFENMTEASSFVGMSIAQSLLFSASSHNTAQKGLRLVSMVALASLGCGDCAGNLSAEAAQKVFESLLGGDRG